MEFEFRYYKDITALNKSGKVPELDKDYILLLTYDTQEKRCCYRYFTTKDEETYKKDFGYKNVDFEKVLSVRETAFNEAQKWGISYIKTYQASYGTNSCYQWVEA